MLGHRKGLFDELPGNRELGLGVAGCHEAIMADLRETSGQDVEEKPPDKLLGGNRDVSLGTGLFVVSGREGDVCFAHVAESLIGDGHPVCVSAEVCEDLLRPGKGRFGVQRPFLGVEARDKCGKCRRGLEVLNASVKDKLVLVKGLLELVEELATYLLGQRLYRDEEVSP